MCSHQAHGEHHLVAFLGDGERLDEADAVDGQVGLKGHDARARIFGERSGEAQPLEVDTGYVITQLEACLRRILLAGEAYGGRRRAAR